ncbi:hypothetical protein V1477_011420 [Vespula maculifrons]|uniref:Uncharacterized protein n=1 Tax=Vespula maculifrons TaxID=7453 RepID=A0ABD2BZ53_VESMC
MLEGTWKKTSRINRIVAERRVENRLHSKSDYYYYTIIAMSLMVSISRMRCPIRGFEKRLKLKNFFIND